MIEEEWRTATAYEGFYEVSNLGNIRSVDRMREAWHGLQRCYGKPIKPALHKFGYMKVTLFRDGKGKTFLVHRLVALAFIPNPVGLPFINHIDGDKANNVCANLEWTDDRTNKQHAIDTGLIKTFKRLLTPAEIAEIRSLGGKMKQSEIATRFGTTQSNVSLILRGLHHVGVS